MENQEILKGNKLIAEFMGFKIGKLNGWLSGTTIEDCAYLKDESGNISKANLISKLKYHSSWDWLMPVVEKIRDCNCVVNIKFLRKLNTTNTFIASFDLKWNKDISENGISIESTFKSVVNFIEWYNHIEWYNQQSINQKHR